MVTCPTLDLEFLHGWPACGIDEAGRGPWAGPVVAACVLWRDPRQIPHGLHDSKQLSKLKRDRLFPLIQDAAFVGVGLCDAEEIDQLNILNATKLAMTRAFEQIDRPIAVALVDGNQPPVLACQTIGIVKGDSLSLSIAAASIIAKVTRDQMMEQLAIDYPQYGWERNAGYGTAEHQQALKQFGVTAHHRRSYAPIRTILHESEAA